MSTKQYDKLIKILKNYKLNLQSNYYNREKELSILKPQTKSLRKEDRYIRARDNLK